MRKLLVVNIAVAALAAGALMSNRADAATLGATAGLRSAIDGAGPVEQVQYWRWRHHRHYGYYGFRSYAFYPRYHHRRHFYYRRGWY